VITHLDIDFAEDFLVQRLGELILIVIEELKVEPFLLVLPKLLSQPFRWLQVSESTHQSRTLLRLLEVVLVVLLLFQEDLAAVVLVVSGHRKLEIHKIIELVISKPDINLIAQTIDHSSTKNSYKQKSMLPIRFFYWHPALTQ
jgi:hypothetical protein